MIVVSLNNTVEEMSGISTPIVHSSIQWELEGAHSLPETEVSQSSQSVHEHDTAPDVEIVEEGSGS